MGTKIGQIRTMSATAIMTIARSAAAALVEREERTERSRMLAYEKVAQMVGMSASTLRKFVNRYTDATPDLIAGLNILAQYGRLCERVERNRDNELAALAALERQIHEIAGGPLRLVEGVAQAASDGKVSPQD